MTHSLANPRLDLLPKIGQEGSKVYLGFVYGGVEHEINPGKEHRLPRVWLQQHQPGIRALHPALALPDPWHKQDTRTQHLVELGTSLFCTYKSFRFLAKEQKDRQTNKMLPSTRQDAATGESPSQRRGEIHNFTVLIQRQVLHLLEWRDQAPAAATTGGRKGLRATQICH